MNGFRIALKPEDSAPPPDPQAVAIELAELIGAHVNDLEWVRDLLTRWSSNPVDVCQRAHPRVVELAAQADQIRRKLETLSQGQRAAGAFSAAYAAERGG